MNKNEKIKEIQRKYHRLRIAKFRKRLKKKAVDYKGGKCSDCGYKKSLRALQFHHTDPNKKDFTISRKTIKFESIIKELDKCILLCSNCHQELHEKEFDDKYVEFEKEINNFKETLKIECECDICKEKFITTTWRKTSINLMCKKCIGRNNASGKLKEYKFSITKDEIKCLVQKKPILQLAKEIGTTAKILSGFCKRENIPIKPAGYWRKTKIQWPQNNELSELVFKKPLVHLSKDLGVSDNAIKKHCKKNGVVLPPRGFWLKKI